MSGTKKKIPRVPQKIRRQHLTLPPGTELQERLVELRRVVKVTKGGRTFRFSALVVVGDGNGLVGFGLGKAREVPAAVEKALNRAKKNLYRVPILHGTIPHRITAKAGAAKVFLRPAAPGTGIIAGNTMRAVLECAGYTDIIAKSLGSNTPHNVVRATIKALTSLEDALSVAQRRQIPLKKVFNG